MKKAWIVFCIVLAICLVFLFTVLLLLGKQMTSLQAEYEQLTILVSECVSEEESILVQESIPTKESMPTNEIIPLSVPLSVDEAETYQHNIRMLDELFGHKDIRSEIIADQCYVLKREGEMKSSRIASFVEHVDTEMIGFITQGGEYYWFSFSGNSIYAILRGADRKEILFAIIE